jgi:hypothetical protein
LAGVLLLLKENNGIIIESSRWMIEDSLKMVDR